MTLLYSSSLLITDNRSASCHYIVLLCLNLAFPSTTAEKLRRDSGIGLKIYKRICDQIASPPQSTIMTNLDNTEVRIPGRQMGATNLTGLMCTLLVSY